MNIIKTERLTKYYGKNKGIENVDFAVKQGDFFGFIGPNGAGKSTTIRTLLGLISQTSGKAEIFGKCSIKNKTEILSKTGYLPSEINLYDGMKVSEIIAFSAKLRGKDCSSEAKSLCKRLALDDSRKAGELSFGNRKKVGIVCALQHKPELYILDEPTSGLDPLIQKEFYTVLSERNKEGATIFLSSHILWEVEKYCKTAAIIRDGKIVVSDSMEKLGHTGIKKVALKGVTSFPEIEKAKNIKFENETVSFLYEGKSENLIQILSEIRFEDVTITDPELEEVFMHFYKGGMNNEHIFS